MHTCVQPRHTGIPEGPLKEERREGGGGGGEVFTMEQNKNLNTHTRTNTHTHTHTHTHKMCKPISWGSNTTTPQSVKVCLWAGLLGWLDYGEVRENNKGKPVRDSGIITNNN